MNSVSLHLALTHVPVIVSLVGLVMLIVALLKKNNSLIKTSYIIIAIAGITALPVYFTGEDAEEAVEHISGISESLIEEHEEVARFAMIAISIAGLLALAALAAQQWVQLVKILKPAVLISSLFAAVLMIQTAHLGGQIRHTEMNNSAVTQNEGGGGAGNGENNSNSKDDD